MEFLAWWLTPQKVKAFLTLHIYHFPHHKSNCSCLLIVTLKNHLIFICVFSYSFERQSNKERGRQRDMEKSPGICWFISLMYAVARAGIDSIRSQKVNSGYLQRWQVPMYEPSSAASQDGQHMPGGHPKWCVNWYTKHLPVLCKL